MAHGSGDSPPSDGSDSGEVAGAEVASAEAAGAEVAGAEAAGAEVAGAEAAPCATSEVTLPVSAGGAADSGGQLGRFQVLRALGAGGMGVVLEADDPELGRRVAIKVLHVGDGSHGQVRRGRLLREARAAARLSHPNVITIHDVGTLEDGHPFIAMELVEGETLAQWQRPPRPWREVIAVYLQAARGLAAAHEAGLVHRDFKPDNVLLGKHGAVKVSDFGIAAVAESGEASTTGPASASGSPSASASGSPSASASGSPSASASGSPSASVSGSPSASASDSVSASASASAPPSKTASASLPSPILRGRLSSSFSPTNLEPLTADGEILGTPAFMAPEQRTSAAVDERADQYAFCVALHHALTGELPFGEDPVTRAERAAARRFIFPRRGRPGPRALYALVERGLAPRPADRFPSMRAVITALERITARRRRLAFAGSLLALSLLAAAVVALTLRSSPSASCGGAEEALALTWNPPPAPPSPPASSPAACPTPPPWPVAPAAPSIAGAPSGAPPTSRPAAPPACTTPPTTPPSPAAWPA